MEKQNFDLIFKTFNFKIQREDFSCIENGMNLYKLSPEWGNFTNPLLFRYISLPCRRIFSNKTLHLALIVSGERGQSCRPISTMMNTNKRVDLAGFDQTNLAYLQSEK